MKKKLLYIFYVLLFCFPVTLFAQTPVALPGTGTTYTENFDGIGSGYPSGFSVNLSSTSSSIGAPGATTIFTAGTTTAWNQTGNGIKNFASGDALASTATSTEQSAATNRALGVRQTSTAGYDPGTAFVFQVTNTTGKKSFKLNFNLQSLDNSSGVTRTTTWIVDYGFGAAPSSFTPVSTTGTMTTGNLTYSNNAVTVDFGNALDNQSGVVTIRVVTLVATTGSGSRASTAIDDWALSWTNNTATPTLTTATTPASSPTALDFGTTQTVNTTSSAQTFTVSGANLTADASLSVTGPYTFSTNGGTSYSTTGTILQASLATPQSVLVKFTPTTTTAAPGTLTITSGTATATVALTGTGAAAPVASLTATPTTLAFGNVNQGVPSVKSYTLSGANLGTNSATVTATAPYTLSKAAGGPFTATLTFTPAELTATTAPTVYVQFSPTTTAAANSSITNTDPDVTTGPSVTVTGTGVVPVLTATTTPATSPTSIDFGNQTIATSATKSYVLTGANIITGSTTTVTSSNAAYTVSKASASGFASSITFNATEIAAGPTVYVQFLAGALGATPATISNTTTGTGATGASVVITGTSVAAPVPLLTLAPTALTFSSLVGSSAAAQSYTITGANISGASSVTVAAPYSVSKTSGGTYATSVAYTTADFPSGSGVQTVWVKFSPTAVAVNGVNNGTAINATAGGTSQNVTLNGTGIGVPALTATGSPLTFSQIINTTSATQSFTLSGVYITANTTLTVAAPYSISKTSTGVYGTSLTYSTTEMASTQTVYVQFTPTTVAAGGVNNGSIGISSTGANSPTVTLNGTGLAVPTLAATPATIAFPVQSISVASAGTAFSLTAANLTTTTTITTTAPFGLSKTLGGTYTTSITYTPAELAAATNVYVNFAPTTTTAFTGTVTVSTPGATNATVGLTGTGIPPPNVAPTLNAITDVTFCYTTALPTTAQTIALSGISPTETTQSIVSVGVTSSNPSLFSQIGILPLTATTAQLNYNIASNASGTAVVTITVKDNGGTANGGIDTYVRTFNITVNPIPVITISASQDGLIEKGQSIQLTANGGAAGATYTWTAVNAGDIISGGSTATATIRPGTLSGSAQTKGPYVYTVVVQNTPTGCPATTSYTLNTYNSQKLFTSNVITPNGDGINDTWQILNIELYPTSNVKVFDKSGKMVFTQDHYLNTWNGYGLNGAPLTQGTYYYVVDLGSGTKYNGYISIVRD
jgi:gliding motility-associated-like protein